MTFCSILPIVNSHWVLSKSCLPKPPSQNSTSKYLENEIEEWSELSGFLFLGHICSIMFKHHHFRSRHNFKFSLNRVLAHIMLFVFLIFLCSSFQLGHPLFFYYSPWTFRHRKPREEEDHFCPLSSSSWKLFLCNVFWEVRCYTEGKIWS